MTTGIDTGDQLPRPIATYWPALAAVAVAGVVRWLLNPWLGTDLPFFTLYLAVIFSAWFGGLKPGLLSVALGFVEGIVAFADPAFVIPTGDLVDFLDRLRFVAVGVCVSVISEALHRQRRRAEAQTEIMRVDTNELHQAQDALREADRRKDEFLAILAHELRNPLAPITNSLELLKRAGGDAAVIQQAHATMERQVRQLVRLVDDLVDVGRITHNKLELRREPVELAPIIHHAVDTCRAHFENAGHELTVALPSQAVRLHADPIRLAQVFENLLTNACKFTEPGGRVRLTAERREQDIVVTVEDTGVGIPPDMLPRIFDLFTQVDGSLDRSAGGLGIGLSLVRQLVQMHGGSVDARSGGVGRGSAFVVRLPVAGEEPGLAPPEPAVARAATRPRRILVVDDNRDAAASLAGLLAIAGHETFMAHDGVDGWEAAERLRPDAMLLDVGLPKLNGHQLCRRVREQPWGRGMAIVAVTGWGQAADRRRSQEAGFDAHVVKPVDHAALEALLQKLGPPGAAT